MKYYSQLVTGIFAAAIAATPAWAGPNVFANFGETFTLTGSVESALGPSADPFTLGVFSQGNECLRIVNNQNNPTGEVIDRISRRPSSPRAARSGKTMIAMVPACTILSPLEE